MPGETDGLIERAAALLRQPGSAAAEGRAGADTPSRNHGDRINRLEDHVGLGPYVPPAPFDAGTAPLAAPILEQEEWGFQHLFRVFSLHKIAFIVTTLLCFVASATVIFSLTPRYTALAVVAVGNQARSVTTRIEYDVEGNVVQASPDDAAVNTQVDYLRSRPVAERAMDYLHLWNLPEFNPEARPRGGLLDTVQNWVEPAGARFREFRVWLSGSEPTANRAQNELAKRNAAVDIFLNKLAVNAEPKSQIITVQFADRDPGLAAAAANAVADQYIARQIEMASNAAQRATEGLEKAVAALRQRVAQSDQAYEHYRGAFEARSGRELLDRANAETSKELAAAEVARQVVEARLRALQGLAGKNPTSNATSEVTESRVMQTLHEQAAVLEGRLAELTTTFGDANPHVQQVRSAIAKLRGEMRGEVFRQTRALEADLKVAISREASLRQSLGATRTEWAQSSGGQAELDALKVEAESNRAVLNAFLTRLHESNTAAKLLARANAEIVAHASVPTRPTFPQTKLLLAVAAVGSALAGFGVAVLRERAAPTFRSSEEIELETGIRTLALVPLLAIPEGPPEEALASPASLYGEAIRTLYMTLLLRQRLKMLVVTSARAGDGKTTLAASLALIAAKAGRKVLLVDADLCTAGASRMFRLRGHEGLTDLIAGSKHFSEVVATAGANPNFHFLAAGAPGNALAARSGLESGLGVLRRLREEYDLIVIDSPPVLAVADAMALSAQADAVLFTVRWNSTPRAAVKLGLRRLRAAVHRVSVGAVLTMVDARVHSRYGYEDSAFYAKSLVGYYGSGGGRA
jgi:capsular exopolysaccharide synthesis family protein